MSFESRRKNIPSSLLASWGGARNISFVSFFPFFPVNSVLASGVFFLSLYSPDGANLLLLARVLVGGVFLCRHVFLSICASFRSLPKMWKRKGRQRGGALVPTNASSSPVSLPTPRRIFFSAYSSKDIQKDAGRTVAPSCGAVGYSCYQRCVCWPAPSRFWDSTSRRRISLLVASLCFRCLKSSKASSSEVFSRRFRKRLKFGSVWIQSLTSASPIVEEV